MNGMIHKAFSLAAAMLLLAGCAGAGETAGQNSGSQSSAPLETKPVTGTVVSTQTENEGGSLTITLSDGSQQTFDYTSESRFDRQPDQLQPGDQVELEVSGEPPMVVTSTLVEEAQLGNRNIPSPLVCGGRRPVPGNCDGGIFKGRHRYLHPCPGGRHRLRRGGNDLYRG